MLKWIKWILAVAVVTFATLWACAYLYGRSLRHVGIIEGRGLLKMAAQDYREHGYITNRGTHQVWLATNTVTISGIPYHCYLMVDVHKFGGHGTLAMTSNQTLDRNSVV